MTQASLRVCSSVFGLLITVAMMPGLRVPAPAAAETGTPSTSPPSRCDEGATFTAIDCRLDALIGQVTAASDIGKVKGLLLRDLNRAKTRKEGAAKLLAEGQTRKGRAALKHAIRWMIDFVHRVGSLTGRRQIGSGTRLMIAEEGRSILRDMQTLVHAPAPTTTTTQPTAVVCEPLVNDGQGIAGTYQMVAVQGPKLCQTNAQQNRFGPCTTEADCGGTQGVTQLCSGTPFATADGFVLPFPEGIKTIFTIAQADAAPTCNNSACVACGNPEAVCSGIPGCGSTPGVPAPGCIRNQCCDQPGFTIPTFLVPLIGGLCSRIDQYRCGFGVVNSSNPQVGDNEVTKTADTSDPGPDCKYGTSDDPPHKPCNAGGSGEGNDSKGLVQRTVGNGTADSSGIQYRLAVPSLSTTWQDMQSPAGQCNAGSTFDPGEVVITQLLLNAEFTTAGATSGFADLNGDGCAMAGAGFTGFNRAGPFTLGSPPAAPQPYDSSTCPAGGVCSTAVSAGVVLTGNGPLFDAGFIAVLTNGAMTRVPTQSCGCTPVQGCPE